MSMVLTWDDQISPFHGELFVSVSSDKVGTRSVCVTGRFQDLFEGNVNIKSSYDCSNIWVKRDWLEL